MEKTVNGMLYRFNEIGSGSISHTAPKSIDKPFTWQSTFKLDSITDFRKTGAFIPPVGVSPGHIASMTIYKPLDTRTFPYVCESNTTEDKYTIELPDQITIESLPENVSLRSDHIKYTIPYHTIPYHTIPYHTIPYHTNPYRDWETYHTSHGTCPYHTIPYHTIDRKSTRLNSSH